MRDDIEPRQMVVDFLNGAISKDELRNRFVGWEYTRHGYKDSELSVLREALTEARGWIELAEDMGRDTTKALAMVDDALSYPPRPL